MVGCDIGLGREADVEIVPPKVLLVSILPYLLSTRVAISLRQVGFAVEAVCPQDHPLGLLSEPPPFHPLGLLGASSAGPFGARACIARAIRTAAPDLVVPCDDQAVAILHDIRRRGGGPEVDRVIEASLGPARSYDLLDSKSAQVALARELGIRTPGSVRIKDEAGLREALATTPLPAFMKRDTTWAGLGVAKVEDVAEACEVFGRMSREHTLASALGRVRTHGWRFSLAGVRARAPAIDLQAPVEGRPANLAVVCREGEVLAQIGVVVVETTSGTGPAAVVQVIDHPQMREAAERMVSHLGASGFLGFDFMLDDAGEAYFLEINARVTPACALTTTRSTDLPAALFSALTGQPAMWRPPIAQELIALFPNEIGRDSASPYLQSAYHDVPAHEPALVAFGRRSVGVTEESEPVAAVGPQAAPVFGPPLRPDQLPAAA